MKPFAFGLQAALRLRERAEQAARLALSEALGRLRQAEQERDRWSIEGDQVRVDLGRIRSLGASADELIQYDRHLQYLGERARQWAAAVEAARAEAHGRQDEWTEAERRRRALERLREKDYARYLQERKKDEERELDEIATTRWGRDRAA